MGFLGIDTSNYTTSAAFYSVEDNKIYQNRKLLPVKQGQCGLRQSDALFHHTSQLSEVLGSVLEEHKGIEAIGVSEKPRYIEGSYMPCFLAGKTSAELLAAALDVPLYYTSHQIGHIAAALYSCGRTDFFEREFIAFHVSGGTTDCLLCVPDKDEIVKAVPFSSSLDLKAGQAVDRVGVMMGLSFPCGKELEKLSLLSDKDYKIKPTLKEKDCCLSGLENRCFKMLSDGVSREDTARYCLSYIGETIRAMTKKAVEGLGALPVVYAGGVMSNGLIKNMLKNDFEAYFAEPEFSCDNAAGVAVTACEKFKREH